MSSVVGAVPCRAACLLIALMMRRNNRKRRCLPAFLSIVSALLLHANDDLVSAFQSNAPCPILPKSPVGRDTSSARGIAASSYPFGNQREREYSTASFLGPLFRDHGRRGLFSTPRIFGSSFSFLDETDVYDDEDLLKYLPSKGKDLAPKTRKLLQRLTSQYVNGGEPVVQLDEVLDVIDEEYKSRDVPVKVGDLTFDFSSSEKVDDADAARILSFAAYHRLPRDIALLLFGPCKNDQDSLLQRCSKVFASRGWKDVQFPEGLALQPKRQYLQSVKLRYLPVPRVWITSRKDAVRKAQVAVDEATYVQAPPRRLLSREEFLATMDEELSANVPNELQPSLFRDALLFFPRQNQKLKKLRKLAKKQSTLLKHAGLAGVISYVALNFAWYTFAIVCHWRHTSATVEISSRALGTALRRFGKVLAAAYIGSQLTRLLRFQIALILAPFGNRALRVTQKKLRISENKAFALLAGIMIGSCLGLWSIIVLGDAALLRTLVM